MDVIFKDSHSRHIYKFVCMYFIYLFIYTVHWCDMYYIMREKNDLVKEVSKFWEDVYPYCDEFYSKSIPSVSCLYVEPSDITSLRKPCKSSQATRSPLNFN